MFLIVSGRFSTFRAAERVARKFLSQGFTRQDISVFFTTPPGQHAQYPIGGDQYADPGAQLAARGAASWMSAGAKKAARRILKKLPVLGRRTLCRIKTLKNYPIRLKSICLLMLNTSIKQRLIKRGMNTRTQRAAEMTRRVKKRRTKSHGAR